MILRVYSPLHTYLLSVSDISAWKCFTSVLNTVVSIKGRHSVKKNLSHILRGPFHHLENGHQITLTWELMLVVVIWREDGGDDASSL